LLLNLSYPHCDALLLSYRASSSDFWSDILVLTLGVQATTVVGTDLLYAAVTKSGGAIVRTASGRSSVAPAAARRETFVTEGCQL